MAYEHILLTETDGIARLTLNRPQERNAMTAEMGREIQAAVQEINARHEVRVVVITGNGKAFSAGGNLDNLKAQAEGREEQGLGNGRTFYELFLTVRDLVVPSIAAVNGHAIGAGLCFALGCDLRVFHQRAKAGMTFVKLGIHPGMAATWHLPRLLGSSRAADLLYTGRLVGATEALELGLANRVAGEDFDQVIDGLARQIAANAPLAVRALKETLRRTFERTLDEAIGAESEAQGRTFQTADAKEGIQAILERREPQFRGQ